MFESLNVYSFVLAALNLIILYFVLRKILFKPVTEFMEKRTNAIKDSIADAENQKAKAEELRLMYEKQMAEARNDGEKIIAEATAKAVRESDKIILEAKKEASSIILSARVEIKREREQMIKEIRTHVADLAIKAASKIIASNMNTEKNKNLLDKFLDEEGAA